MASVVLVTLPQVTVAAAGTEQRISAASVSYAVKVYITAPLANTGNIWVGDSSVAVGRGVEVIKGTTLVIDYHGSLIDLYNIWVDAATSGDKASIAYLAKAG